MKKQLTAEQREAAHRSWFPWSRHANGEHPAHRAIHDSRTFGERVADQIASFGGSWPFIFIFLGLIAAWMVLNTLLLARVVHHKQFDPYPFIALNLVLSALAGLQAPIIMMSQNRAAVKDEALADHHYKEGRKIERLMETTKELLDTNTDLTKQVHDLALKIHELVTAAAPPR